MKSKFPNLVCANCGSNRLKLPEAASDEVKCEECGQIVATLDELQDRLANGENARETREQRRGRHAKEIAESHAKLRASVAETDRLIVESNDMINRHRKEANELDE